MAALRLDFAGMQAAILRLASCLAEPIGVIALVGEKLLGSGQGGQHQRRAFEVAHLAFAEQHHKRSAFAVANRLA
jgi:hypothetical protein